MNEVENELLDMDRLFVVESEERVVMEEEGE